jgi:uncharacterized RDD family membrane protein YckC
MLAAGIVNPILNERLQALSGADFISTLISNLISVALIVGVVVFFFMFISGAISWMTSGGDKAAMEEARKRVVNSLVGLVIMFTTWAIISLIEYFFGVNIISIDLVPLSLGPVGS